MSKLPKTDASLLVRTDFSSATAWADLLREVSQETADGFRAYVEVVDDKTWDQASLEALRKALPDPSNAAVMFVADRVTLETADRPVVVIDLWGDHPQFRCIASELWGPDNNLNIANMDFYEFADAAGPDGVFRGFPRSTT